MRRRVRRLEGLGTAEAALSDLMNTHRQLLERWRKSMNLVGPGPIDVHFDDCTLALSGLQPVGHWVDLGSGAGFPGLVLASLWPELQLDLVDSRQKRCVFLEAVLAEAGVPSSRVQVLRQRVEDLTGPYDGAVARAFAAPERVLEFAERLVRPDGLVVLFLQADTEPPERTGFELFHVEHYEVQKKRRKAVTMRRS